MHAKAKAEIKKCYERNKRGDPAYKSLTQSMKARLQQTVGNDYWKKAVAHNRAPLLSTTEHSTNSARSSGSGSLTQTQTTEQEKTEKEKFLMFTRVLMK